MRTKSPHKSRRDAASAGASRFYTGVPCKAGHDAERYTTNGGCVECVNVKYTRREIRGSNVHQLAVAFPAFKLVNGKPIECPPPTPALIAFVQGKILGAVAGWAAEFDAQAQTPRVLVPTDKTMGTPLDEFRAKGWTDAQLVQHGYAVIA